MRRQDARTRKAPAERQVWRKLVLPMMALVVGAVVTFVGLNHLSKGRFSEGPWFPIRRIEVAGHLDHLSPAAVAAILAPAIKSGFFTADLATASAKLRVLPWVAEAEVSRRWPDTLRVVIQEQEPVARWGNEGLLNAKGEVFRPVLDETTGNLPVLYGLEARAPALLRRLHVLAMMLKPAGLRVRGLIEDERRAVQLLLESGILVLLGRAEENARVARFGRVYPLVLAPQAQRIKAIDLRYANGLAVVWRDALDTGG